MRKKQTCPTAQQDRDSSANSIHPQRFLGPHTWLQMAEEKGELPTRAALEVNVRGNPFANFDAVAIDDDGNLHPVK